MDGRDLYGVLEAASLNHPAVKALDPWEDVPDDWKVVWERAATVVRRDGFSELVSAATQVTAAQDADFDDARRDAKIGQVSGMADAHETRLDAHDSEFDTVHASVVDLRRRVSNAERRLDAVEMESARA